MTPEWQFLLLPSKIIYRLDSSHIMVLIKYQARSYIIRPWMLNILEKHWSIRPGRRHWWENQYQSRLLPLHVLRSGRDKRQERLNLLMNLTKRIIQLCWLNTSKRIRRKTSNRQLRSQLERYGLQTKTRNMEGRCGLILLHNFFKWFRTIPLCTASLQIFYHRHKLLTQYRHLFISFLQ